MKVILADELIAGVLTDVAVSPATPVMLFEPSINTPLFNSVLPPVPEKRATAVEVEEAGPTTSPDPVPASV